MIGFAQGEASQVAVLQREHVGLKGNSMATELTAIVGTNPGPGHGECFIWQRKSDDLVVAVDAGGAASVGLAASLLNPQILVLSHDDKDHISGAVAMIGSCRSIRELWVPVEWGILLEQIARTPPEMLIPRSDAESTENIINVEDVAEFIAEQLFALEGADGEELSARLVADAERNLRSWNPTGIDGETLFAIESEDESPFRHWYGAADLDEIITRVRKRARVLIAILKLALDQVLSIRFFSIDLALRGFAKSWEIEGNPGDVTLANAAEAPHALKVSIPAGIAYSYALTKLTVQNRRALCTVLWSDQNTLDDCALIWSDTDGKWLAPVLPRGFSKVIARVAASSAPHHASGNASHADVWAALQRAPSDAVFLSAGGQVNQAYASDYLKLGGRKACTWCRPTPRTYRSISAGQLSTGRMVLPWDCAHHR